jgi:hypothetical protein
MTIFDFIQYRLFRIKPSRQYIDSLVEKLIPDQSTDEAKQDLKRLGAVIVPSLVAALHNPRFLEKVKRSSFSKNQPYEAALELLVPHSPEDVIATAKEWLRSPSEDLRKTAALHSASLGREETVPLLAEFLNDAEGYVRAYVGNGVGWALSKGVSEGYRQKMYDLLLVQCDQDWGSAINGAAEIVCQLDPKRAAVDFASERWLSPTNPEVHQILKACNEKAIKLPASPVRKLYEHFLPLAVGERCYPYQNIVAESLVALAASLGEEAKPLLVRALESDQERIKVSAAEGLAKLYGIDNPDHFVLGRLNKVGYRRLTQPQKYVFCSYYFDAEVSNGGLSQFFTNSGAPFAKSDAQYALRAIGPPEVAQVLDAAIEHIETLKTDPTVGDLHKAFEPLDSKYYQFSSVHNQKRILYAIENKEHFR